MEEINLQEIAEIELFILKRMKEFTLGDHASVFKGSGFNFVGIRDWQPGDRMSNIDWAQSSLNNFSPLITREFEQDSNAAIVAVADASLSTRCGIEADLIATVDRACRRGRRALGDVLPGSLRRRDLQRSVRAGRRRAAHGSDARTCSTASICIASRCSARTRRANATSSWGSKARSASRRSCRSFRISCFRTSSTSSPSCRS